MKKKILKHGNRTEHFTGRASDSKKNPGTNEMVKEVTKCLL